MNCELKEGREYIAPKSDIVNVTMNRIICESPENGGTEGGQQGGGF